MNQLRRTAFSKYLLALPPERAREHLLDCLRFVSSNNAAWELWGAVHGDKKFNPKDLACAVDAILIELKKSETA